MREEFLRWMMLLKFKSMRSHWMGGFLKPLEAPMKDGKLDTGENRDVSSGKFDGFVNHYNITARKIDCAGLDLVKLLNEVKAD